LTVQEDVDPVAVRAEIVESLREFGKSEESIEATIRFLFDTEFSEGT
jgi:hypothetical protein